MTQLHCLNCKWQQDHFWSEAYSPLHGEAFEVLQKALLSGLRRRSAHRFIEAAIDWADENDIPYVECGGKARILLGDYLAWEMERRAGLFRMMVYWSTWEYESSPRCCPQCGSDQLSTDEIVEEEEEEVDEDKPIIIVKEEPKKKRKEPKKKAPAKKAVRKKTPARRKAPQKKKKAEATSGIVEKAVVEKGVATIYSEPEKADPTVPAELQSLQGMSAENRQRTLQQRSGLLRG